MRQSRPTDVVPRRLVKGWMTVSSPMVTPASMTVEAGSTIGDAAAHVARGDALLGEPGDDGEVGAVVDAEGQRGVVDLVDVDALQLREDVGEVLLALGVGGARAW